MLLLLLLLLLHIFHILVSACGTVVLVIVIAPTALRSSALKAVNFSANVFYTHLYLCRLGNRSRLLE